MRLLLLPIAVVLLGGCAYVSKEEFRSYWDADGDGWPLGTGPDDDCDPGNNLIHPYAADVRGDGCDADCGKELDDDGDDWPNDADCDSSDPTAFPCSPFEQEGDGVDSDCDGRDGVRTEACPDLDPDFPEDEQSAIAPDVCGYPAANAAE